MLVREPVSKKKREDVPDDDPFDHGGEAPGPGAYPEQVKVTLEFKERLEKAAAFINRTRRREGFRKRAEGWFIAKHLEGWLSTVEAAMKSERGDGA